MRLKESYGFSAGGESVAENCQILQTRVNRYKGNKEGLDGSTLKGYSCDIKFTGIIYLLLAVLFNVGIL